MSNGARLRRHRSAGFLAVLASVAVIAAACGGGGGGTKKEAAKKPAGEGTPVHGGHIVVGVESETNNYAPHLFAGTQAGVNVALTIYDPIAVRDTKGKLVPYLAQSITPNTDLTEWTVKLRSGIKFHDGTDLTAQVQKQAYDEFISNKAAGSVYTGTVKDVASVQVVDPLTYKYVLSRANAAFEDVLTGPVGWPFSIDAAHKAPNDFGNKPVGTGPFLFDHWLRDGEFVVKRNPNYWQKGLPYLDQITFRPIPDEDARLAALQSKDIDATHSVRLSGLLLHARDLAKTGSYVMYEKPGNTGSGAIFNTTKPPVDDVRIRKSLTYALNQDDLISVVAGKGATKPRKSYYAPGSPWHSDKADAAYPSFDATKAKQLYNEYINDPKRSDGKPVGAPVEIQYNCTAVASLQQQAQAYQAMWQSIGYKVALTPLEQSIHIQNALTGKYMINCWRQGSDADPYTYLSTTHGDPKTNVGNFTRFTSPDLQALIDQLRTGKTFQERYDALEKAQLLIADGAPVIWTGGNNEFIIVRKGIAGVDTWKTPDGTTGNGAQGGQTLWGQVWVTK